MNRTGKRQLFPTTFGGLICSATVNQLSKTVLMYLAVILWAAHQDSPVPTETGAEVEVYAAKNEFEPFQVVVKPATSANLTVSMDSFGSGIIIELWFRSAPVKTSGNKPVWDLTVTMTWRC